MSVSASGSGSDRFWREALRASLLGAALALAACGRAESQTPPGGAGVSPPSDIVLPSPSADLSAGLAAADRRDWDGVRLVMAQALDPTVRDILLWRLATADGEPARYAEAWDAVDRLTGWPMATTMRNRAEARTLDAAIAPQDAVSRLTGDGGPISGEGKLALARARLALGDREQAQIAARDAWRTHRMDTAVQDQALLSLGDLLTPEDHAARVALLTWADRRTQARRLLDRLTADDRALAEARFAAAEGRGTDFAFTDDPFVKAQRARRLRDAEQDQAAIALLQTISPAGLPETAQDALWRERRILISEAIRDRNWRAVYALASQHGYRRGERFADGEFVAGWAALRFLNEPQTAARHFRTLDEGVGTAVSKARAGYWRGRAAEALGDEAGAETFYRAAARHSTTYYGQLAALRLPDPVIDLPEPARWTPAEAASVQDRPLARAMKLAAAAGATPMFSQFALALDDQLTTPGEHALVAALARDLGQPAVAVRTAKTGLGKGVIATDAAFPLPTLPDGVTGPGRAEAALSLAITRQESEFNTLAVSSAGARGLMQLLPSTAQMEARALGLSYSFSALTGDPAYNMTLGAGHLYRLVNDFGGSYILAIAAYNAGPTRVRQWLNEFGDPRDGGVDPVDWVEMIPFSETRNYVQRVLENVQVYRYRLADRPTPIRLADDLNRGQGRSGWGSGPGRWTPPAAAAPTGTPP